MCALRLRKARKLLAGGRDAPHRAAASIKGFYFAPTVLEEVQPTMRVACDEIFGPVAMLIAV
jgi:acyl-CoA reductase-like NAD-dependent aldehyde dehydrogenase